MSHENIESELFVDLDAKQQEIVSGGGQLTGIADDLHTFYNVEQSLVALNVAQVSGPQGSSNMQSFGQAFENINTGAYKGFDASFA